MSTASVVNRLQRARRGVGVAGPGPTKQRANRKTRVGGRRWTLIALVVPSVALILLINLYPVIYAATQSVRNGTLISSGNFVGFDNYRHILTESTFWNSALFTLIFTVTGVFGSWITGLALALLLRTKIPAGALFKVLLLLPWVVPIVVSATSWNWLVATPQSPFPRLAAALGLGNVLFLANPVLAQITVCIFKVWISFPFMMMMMSAALSAIDQQVYEAARVDGAGRWQVFAHITMPLISRTTYISWILMTIFCVNDFPSIFLLTGGGPVNSTTSLIVLAYRTVFQNFQTGTGVATAYVMTMVLIVISVVLYRQIRKASIE
jgi:multiple sugar transport system permease protein